MPVYITHLVVASHEPATWAAARHGGSSMWAAFLKKNGLVAVPLSKVVMALRATLQPALVQAALLVAA